MTGVLVADGKGNVHMDSAGSIARAVLDWDVGWNDLTIERNIFGTTDPEEIADLILSFVRHHLGRAAMRCLFYETSMGCVLGLSLDDGRTIALKAQPPGLQLDRLLAAQRVQTHLADHGFPAPRPILPPTKLVQGYATVEEWSARGEYRNPHEPRIRTALATLLAAIARLGTHLDTSGLRRTGHGKHDEGVLWGTPHSTLFDFVATSSGAEWIDALAWQARPLLRKPVGEDALGHSDWKAAHVRFDGEEATAVYDWDSVVYDTEAIIVGSAAHSFTMHSLPPLPIAPSLNESCAFIASYEKARGRRFVGEERRTLAAALTRGMAYTARCEHSRDPIADPLPSGSYRAELWKAGEAWLAV